MSVSDPIADYFSRIRNAIHAKHKKVDIPYSNIKKEISKILQEEKYVKNYTLISGPKGRLIRIYLKYDESENNVITGLKRISKPGLRHYVSVTNLPRVLNNLGIAILSTPQGVITNKKARKKHIGGEVLCYVW